MARNYKELYEKMINSDWFKKAYYNKSLGECPITVEELEESEDERIRKDIIQFFKDAANSKTRVVCSNTFAEWATYLEKQKEQKPANVDYISGIRDELLGIENNAKNIDGLTDSQWVAIRAAHRLLGEYLNSNQKPAEWSDEDEKVLKGIVYLLEGYIFPNSLYGEDARYGISWLKSLHPQPHKDMPDVIAEVTKDKESAIKFLKGVGIVNENGELAEIYRSEQKPTESSIYPSSLDEAIQLYYDTYGDGKGGFAHLSLPKFEDIVKEFVKDYRQKPAEWSEEDKIRLKVIKEELERFIMFEQYGTPLSVDDIDWIESLPERFNLQPKQEWSEEDDKMLKSIIEDSQNCHILGVDQIDWIKSLRPQPKQEWSEEDEKFINNLCNLLASLTKNNRIGCYYAPDIINKIKSLHPKPHWKPSEEQMEALNEIINTLAVSKHPHESDYLFNILSGLRKNLKKL